MVKYIIRARAKGKWFNLGHYPSLKEAKKFASREFRDPIVTGLTITQKR